MKNLDKLKLLEDLDLTGIYIYYYFVEPKRLWYYAKGITMEHNSEDVEIGKIISEFSYKREKKEIQIGRIKIDFYKKNLEIHETKKSSKFKEASYWQLIFYLWFLKQFRISCKGTLDFPKEKKRTEIILNKNLENKLLKILKHIREIISSPSPPKTNKFIKKSAYYEFFMA